MTRMIVRMIVALEVLRFALRPCISRVILYESFFLWCWVKCLFSFFKAARHRGFNSALFSIFTPALELFI